MKKSINVLLILLIFWFTLDITGFSLGGFCLVENSLFSVDAIWWGVFIICSALFIFKERFGKYVLVVFLSMWAVIEYFCHWNYTIFGASKTKLEGYNKYFAKTYHIISPSNKILIPDLYHIVEHILIVLLLILLMIYIYKNCKKLVRFS